MKIILLFIIVAVNIPLYRWSFKKIFGTKEVFYECLRYDFTPDFVSLFKGELLKDMAAEYQLSSFLFLNILVIMGEYFLLMKLLSILGIQFV